MTRESWFVFPLVLFCLSLYSQVAHAANINAASCSSSDVQTAINSASAGDTVNVPSGSCTWTTQVNVSTKITLQGQTTCSGTPASSCVDNTNITTGAPGLSVTSSVAAFIRVTGFTFKIAGADQNNGGVLLQGTEADVAFRFDHNHMVITNTTGTVGALMNMGTYGLVDHCVFDDSGSNEHAIGIHGDWANAGFLAWNRPLTLGTGNAFYAEDSTFNLFSQTDGLADGYTGGRIVFRHNNVIYAGSSAGADAIGFHGTDSGSYRSFFSAEIYNNTFTNNAGGTMTSFRSRGGTALVFSNTFDGSSGWNGITLQDYRADGSGNVSSWGNCDGTNWELESTDPTTQAGRTNSTNGGTYWAAANRDTTTSSVTTAFFDNNPGGSGPPGYACRDQPGRTHNQAMAPDYEWLNNPDVGIGPYGAANYIVANQDYYAYTSSFTGATGVGSGLLSARPSTCAPGVAYWGTDTMTLYQCTSTNTWSTYYTPYTYPHPLQGGNPPPAPPTALAAKVQ